MNAPMTTAAASYNDHGTAVVTTAMAIIVAAAAISAPLAIRSRRRRCGCRRTAWTKEVVTEYAAADVIL